MHQKGEQGLDAPDNSDSVCWWCWSSLCKCSHITCLTASSHHDTIFVRIGLLPEPHSLSVAQLCLLFSFIINSTCHKIALIEWFSYIGNSPDENTGMWVVEREKWDDGSWLIDFISIDTILWSCHLLPIYGKEMVLRDITHMTSLESFQVFYINKFVDHHSFELLS
jgi:hypothetical protein